MKKIKTKDKCTKEYYAEDKCIRNKSLKSTNVKRQKKRQLVLVPAVI